MNDLIYIIVILIATTLGSFSGIGGGVIIKPVLDAFGEYNATQISVISSCSVFAMSLMSTLMSAKQLKEHKDHLRIIISIALGAAFGGWLGEFIFTKGTQNVTDSIIKTVQNIILFILICFVIVYMQKDKRKSFNRKSIPSGVATGLFLGVVSAFLGIGGGPINVAFVILIFGFDIKTAVVCSLTTILFSQGAKLITVASGGIGAFKISILPFAIIAGVAGALIGRTLNKKASSKLVKGCFIAVQVLILNLSAFNIAKYF